MKVFFAVVIVTLVSTKAYAGLIEASFTFEGTKLFDSLTISYRMFISDAATNMLSSIDDDASYSIWNTLSNSSAFVNPNATEVSEPHNLLFVLLSAIGLVAARRVKS